MSIPLFTATFRSRSCLVFVLLAFLFGSESSAALLVDYDSSISWSVLGNPVTEWKDQSGNEFHATTTVGAIFYQSPYVSEIGLSGVKFSGGCHQMEIMTAEESDRLLDFSDGTGGFSVIIAFTDQIGFLHHNGKPNDKAFAICNSRRQDGFYIRFDHDSNNVSFSLSERIKIGPVADGDSVVVGLNYDADTGFFTAMTEASSGLGSTLTGTVPAADFSTSDSLFLGNYVYDDRYFEGIIHKVLIYDNELSAVDFANEMQRLTQTWIVSRSKSVNGPSSVPKAE